MGWGVCGYFDLGFLWRNSNMEWISCGWWWRDRKKQEPNCCWLCPFLGLVSLQLATYHVYNSSKIPVHDSVIDLAGVLYYVTG
jgi:hypothetical protein